jgi:hypothetical protein
MPLGHHLEKHSVTWRGNTMFTDDILLTLLTCGCAVGWDGASWFALISDSWIRLDDPAVDIQADTEQLVAA